MTANYGYDSWRLTTITQGAQSATLGWACQDRLKSYTTTITGETSVNYTYAGDGRRTGVDASIYGQGPKTWSYDTKWGVRSQNYTNTPANSMWYILEPNGTVLAQAPATGVVTTMSYFFRDHLGSTRSIRREDTTKAVSFEYEPYGKVYTSSGLGQLYTQDRFTGHEYDYETNMYWAPYRNYRPDMLRWISRDPAGMVDGPNLYGYVGGNPISAYDLAGQALTPLLMRTSGYLFLGLLVGCSAIAEMEAANSPKGPHISHCIFGCSLSRCSKGMFGANTSFLINHVFEIATGDAGSPDSTADDGAAMDGASSCGSSCDQRTCYECCQAKGYKDNSDLRREVLDRLGGT